MPARTPFLCCALLLGAVIAQDAPAQGRDLSRFAVTVGWTRLAFPDLYMSATGVGTLAARLRVAQRGNLFAAASARLAVPSSATSTEASCLPSTLCASTMSPSRLVEGSVAVGRRVGDKLTLAGQLGGISASGMRGGGRSSRVSLGADLSWALRSSRFSPVLGITATSFLGGSRGYVSPSIGMTW